MFAPIAMENNLDQKLDKLQEAVGPWADVLLRYGVIALVAIVVLYVVVKLLKRRKRKLPEAEPDLGIDVATLPAIGPPPAGPRLYYYNVPVRLAALVLAPAGRIRQLPPVGLLHELLDSIVSGLSGVVAGHKPTIRRWPAQLSVRGFVQQFFIHARLPGQGGKGTPWCSVAGTFKMEGQALVVGMVFRADAATNLGQRAVEQEAQWLDVLRIKEANT
jgi:hypothetical protein